MLAKIWKKVLLAVCIIACLYNITSKLVKRTSLESNLNAVKDGESIFQLDETKTENKVLNSQKNINDNTLNSASNNVEKESDFVVIY